MTGARGPTVGAVVVGAQKAGTTSLYAAFARHPDVAVPAVKETKVFVRDDRWSDRVAVLADAFPAPGGRMPVEVDPDCMAFEQAAHRIREHNPAARVVISLRDPVARLVSHVRMNQARAVEPLDVPGALAAEDARVARGTTDRIHYSYLSRSCYATAVAQYLDVLGRDQVLVVRFEDLVADWATGWRRITDHCGLDPLPTVATMPHEHGAGGVRSSRLSAWFYTPEGPVRRSVKSALKRVPGSTRVADAVKAWNHRGPVPDVDLPPPVAAELRDRLRRDAEALAPLVDFDPMAWPSLAGAAP